MTGNERVKSAAVKTFEAIGAKKYARIDMRVSRDGTPYILEVNLYPGLGNTGYMYRCFEQNTSIGYREFLEIILSTAEATKTTL